MPIMQAAKTSLLGKIVKAVLPEKLAKAKLRVITKPSAIGAAQGTELTVQFNPSEYSISRRVSLSQRQTLGKDSVPQKSYAVSSAPSVLTVALYFDGISDLHDLSLGGLISTAGTAGAGAAAAMALKDQFLPGGKDPTNACADLMRLVKFNKETHQPPMVNFIWGPLDFEGRLESLQAHYTMFAPDGTPVRARVELRIVGEERSLVDAGAQQPFESPDRTKERTLAQGDQLWMIAGQEYDDPGKWKVIAEANGILNPRRLESAAVLKVPSIK